MALPFSPDHDPAFPMQPISPPLIAVTDYPHLSCDGTGDGLASMPSPQPTPGVASLASTAPDPAAHCGMPDRPLAPHAFSMPSTSSAARTRLAPPRSRRGAEPAASGTPPRARGGAGGETLPLADRCWDLFCQGHSYAAIGRTLGLDRETAARHVKALHQQVQADRRADRALALSRALATQQRLQATAWTLLAQAQAQLPAPSAHSPLPAGEGSGVRSSGSPPRARGGVGGEASLADCARLLNIILASARETARLELLYDRDAPARTADQEPPQPVHIVIERVGDPYVDPTHPPAQPAPLPPQSGDPVPSDPVPTDPVPTGADSAPAAPSAGDAAPPASQPMLASANAGAPAAHAAPSPPPLEEKPEERSATAPPRAPARSRGEASSSPLPRGEGLGVRSSPRGEGLGVRSSPRRVRFGLPVANGYPLG